MLLLSEQIVKLDVAGVVERNGRPIFSLDNGKGPSYFIYPENLDRDIEHLRCLNTLGACSAAQARRIAKRYASLHGLTEYFVTSSYKTRRGKVIRRVILQVNSPSAS